MSNLSTFYPAPITAADLGLGAASNATFGSIQNTPIGSTTPNSGAFTTLNATNGTITASAPVLDLSQTWDNAAVAFTGFRFNATDTASSQNSSIAEFQLNGASYLRIQKGKNTGLQCCLDVGATTNASMDFQCGGNRIFRVYGAAAGSQPLYLQTNGGLQFSPINPSTSGFRLEAEAANTLAARQGTAGQTFNIYNTFTNASNHERLRIGWASNVAIIGTEKAGTGSARALEFQTDGTTRWKINGTARALLSVGGGSAIIGSDESYAVEIVSGAAGGWRTGYFSPNGTGTGYLAIGEALHFGLATNGTSGDTRLFRDAASALALRNSTTAQIFRIYNTVSGTGNVNFERANFRWASNEFIIDAEAGGTGTSLRGIKIGSATSSLLGFYGATPVDRPATVADPAGGGTVDTEARTAINDLIDRLQELGLIA